MKKPATIQIQGTAFERSNGNVFADLGLAQPEEIKTKLVLAVPACALALPSRHEQIFQHCRPE